MVGSDDRIERAGLLYERAVFGGDAGALATAKRELDGVEADLALARGRIVHARFLEGWDEDPRDLALFERAVRLYRMLGDARGEGETLFWVGVFHQVIRHDDGTSVPALKRSLELATQVGDRLTISYALRHLGIAEHTTGRLEAARAVGGVGAAAAGGRVLARGRGKPGRSDLHRCSARPPRRGACHRSGRGRPGQWRPWPLEPGRGGANPDLARRSDRAPRASSVRILPVGFRARGGEHCGQGY